MNKWLESALDYGISEFDFWNMTLGELGRLIESKRRMEKLEQQSKASFDYILADTIGRSVARIYNSSNEFPPIYQVYPTLFDNEEIAQKQQEQKAELSALRFTQFANSFNARFKEAKEKVE